MFNSDAFKDLLMPWLLDADDYAMECRAQDEHISEFAILLLSHILNFSDQHSKLEEVAKWLGTEDAKKYFTTASDHSMAVYREFQIIDELAMYSDLDKKEIDPEFMADYLDGIRAWVAENYQDLPGKLILNAESI